MTGEPSSSRAESGPAKPYVNNRRTSVLLREYMASLDAPKASLDSLRDALGDRGFGVLLFIFALPNLIPVNIPLLSAVLGAPLVLLAAQLTYGRQSLGFLIGSRASLCRGRISRRSCVARFPISSGPKSCCGRGSPHSFLGPASA
jgi:hypothetical protein